MSRRLLVFYGSYRADRMGIRLAEFLVAGFKKRGDRPELVDAREENLPILDRMYKEHEKGHAPPRLEALAEKIRTADGFIFVAGEYNWGPQPGLKNLTDHFLEEWYWRPAAIASYSAGRTAGVRSSLIWHGILSEMGMVVTSSSLAVASIGETLDDKGLPLGDSGRQLDKSFGSFAADLSWWVDAAKAQRATAPPPY